MSGQVIGALNQRKGTIVDTEVRDDEFTMVAEVSLNDMFGCTCSTFAMLRHAQNVCADSSQLRGMTQGKGEFSMEFANYSAVLPNVQARACAGTSQS